MLKMQFTPTMMHLQDLGTSPMYFQSGVKYIEDYLSGKYNITGLHIFEIESAETITLNKGIFLTIKHQYIVLFTFWSHQFSDFGPGQERLF